MKYFQMAAVYRADSTVILLKTHRRAILKSGLPLEPGFESPVVVKLDDHHADGRLPTFYESPAFIGTQEFHRALVEAGATNIETVPVVIQNHVTGTECLDYILMNIVGRVACADMARTQHRSLGPGMTIIGDLILKPADFRGLQLFVDDTDTDVMVVSEQVYLHVSKLGYTDVVFRAL